MISPVKIGLASLYRMDCMEFMASLPDKAFDLAIIDPPYRDVNSPTQSMRKVGGKMTSFGLKPTKDYFFELKRVSANQIVWGGNNFELPPTNCFICWDKACYIPNYSQCELAWTSFDSVAKLFYYAWTGLSDGIVGRNKTEKRIHPTQKPVKLYEWLLTNYAKPGQRILDTHLGSMSSVIAANNLGFELVGCELDGDYFEAGCARAMQATAQSRMF